MGPRNSFGDVPRNDALNAPPVLKNSQRSPACLVAGPSLYDGKIVPQASKGRTKLKPPDSGTEGSAARR